jgi:hypothetical protein
MYVCVCVCVCVFISWVRARRKAGGRLCVHFLGAETRHAIGDDPRLVQRLLVLVGVLVVARCLVCIYKCVCVCECV